jgi:excinuclease UvrABC ATPase subunit
MIENNVEKMICPKCKTLGDVMRFDRDIFIVRKDMKLEIRTLYGCNACKNIFTYDTEAHENLNDINLTNVFYDIPSGKREDIKNRTAKKRVVNNRHR